MPTIDGKYPSPIKIAQDAKTLEDKINSLIKEFTNTYETPILDISKGSVYKIEYQIDDEKLTEFYKKTDPAFKSFCESMTQQHENFCLDHPHSLEAAYHRLMSPKDK